MNYAKDAIRGVLLRSGYYGLYNEDIGCACSASDPMTCGRSADDLEGCLPAAMRKCPKCGEDIFITVQAAQAMRW